MGRPGYRTTAVHEGELEQWATFCRHHDDKLPEVLSPLDVIRSLYKIARQSVRETDELRRDNPGPILDGTVHTQGVPSAPQPVRTSEAFEQQKEILDKRIRLEEAKRETARYRALSGGGLSNARIQTVRAAPSPDSPPPVFDPSRRSDQDTGSDKCGYCAGSGHNTTTCEQLVRDRTVNWPR